MKNTLDWDEAPIIMDSALYHCKKCSLFYSQESVKSFLIADNAEIDTDGSNPVKMEIEVPRGQCNHSTSKFAVPLQAEVNGLK